MRLSAGRFGNVLRGILGAALLLSLSLGCVTPAAASATMLEVPGKVYGFEERESYAFEEEYLDHAGSTYGTFALNGSYTGLEVKNGVSAIGVSDGGLELYYNYGDTLLNAPEDDWHLVEDRSRTIDGITLDTSIGKGAIVIQTSKDRTNWVTVQAITDAFQDTPVRSQPLYTATQLDLINGCYYRLIVAYELGIRTEENRFFFFNMDRYDYKKAAEVYEFYAYTETGAEPSEGLVPSDQTCELGSVTKAEQPEGYSGSAEIGLDDMHYGWDLGQFFVSGCTDTGIDEDGNPVLLKNTGDKLTLWFRLEQDIDQLNGQRDLAVTGDRDGYDRYFETERMDFGRGALLLRRTDEPGGPSQPTVYTNFLEANASLHGDTKVELLEEGDYEVALDYEVTRDRFFDEVGHYRIFFRFSVRNGDCALTLVDAATGEQLPDRAVTEQGFRLDLTGTRYLDVDITREILNETGDGLETDPAFLGQAAEGESCTGEGIYTVTARNGYTGQEAEQTVYVGSDPLLVAHMKTGLSIPEINAQLEQGATITPDGEIVLNTEPVPILPDQESQQVPASQPVTHGKGDGGALGVTMGIILVIAVLACGGAAALWFFRTGKRTAGSGAEGETGREQGNGDPEEAPQEESRSESESESDSGTDA